MDHAQSSCISSSLGCAPGARTRFPCLDVASVESGAATVKTLALMQCIPLHAPRSVETPGRAIDTSSLDQLDWRGLLHQRRHVILLLDALCVGTVGICASWTRKLVWSGRPHARMSVFGFGVLASSIERNMRYHGNFLFGDLQCFRLLVVLVLSERCLQFCDGFLLLPIFLRLHLGKVSRQR